MIGETIHDLEEGTSQDGPLWPLLSKILLYDLDKELANGERYYASGCTILY
jgi:hypothetical protein